MQINTELLRKVTETPGIPGNEDRIRKVILSEIEPLVDEISVDNIGNIIALKKGKSDKKLASAAHMDEIGFIVKHIDDNGFIRFHHIGGFDPKTLVSQRVTVHGEQDLPGVMGTKPIHIMKPEEKKKMPEVSDFYIDVGLPKEEVEKHISIGDPISRFSNVQEMGETYNAKSLDNRICVYVLIEALKNIKEPSCDFYAVFSCQEEVGIRGASVAAHTINPDLSIALDTTLASDGPGAGGHEKVTELGKGAAVKIMDSSAICDKRMVKFLKETANQNDLNYQAEILTAGGTDTSGLQRMGKDGSIAGAISVPTRYLHQTIETCHKEDIKGAVQLLTKAAEAASDYDWNRQ